MDKPEKTKVKVMLIIEIEDFAFMGAIQSGLIKFSKETKANILKSHIKEIKELNPNKSTRSL